MNLITDHIADLIMKLFSWYYRMDLFYKAMLTPCLFFLVGTITIFMITFPKYGWDETLPYWVNIYCIVLFSGTIIITAFFVYKLNRKP